MAASFNNTLEKQLLSELKNILSDSKIGIEKESLRVINRSISQKPHPHSLGSSLCNRYITTDFSEAQLELVTPPTNEKYEGLEFLEDIHHFVSSNIDDEILWPFSMPTHISNEEDISIANYGSSNLGKFKKIYRNGLSHRYGRIMQSISGIHYNYSLPESLWQSEFIKSNSENPMETRSSAYFNMLRNIYRMNWLILYLFGASPIITKSFIATNNHSLKQLDIDSDTYYLPYATSLRMSDFGYSNAIRNNLKVSMNSLKEYVSDLREATSIPFDDFLAIDAKQQQINANVLQIDDEYYAIARAKSATLSNLRTTSKLTHGGVDFIELRSLDLNPYSRIGIDKETLFFLESLSIYCFIKQGPKFTDDEIKEINQNDSIVAEKGRAPNLNLLKSGERISLKTWGKKIIENLLPIAALLDCEKKEYTNALDQMIEKINDTKLTTSGRFLDEILSRNINFIDFGRDIGESNKAYYLNLESTHNTRWSLLENESRDSHNQLKKLERNDKKSYKSFVEDYFKH